MAKVFIIDANPMFSDFLKDKFAIERIEVETVTHRDAFTKLINALPELIILNIEKYSDTKPINPLVLELLQKKMKDPNIKKTPIIVTGPQLDRKEIAKLVQFGVIKYFKKPIKFDVLFESLGKILNGAFAIDSTPCVLDVHLNNNIIFIEVAMGLNREKISLLKYKLAEIIEKNELSMPKVILMMTSLTLSFVDGMNIELLFNTILSHQRIFKNNLKVLSLDSIVEELVEGHPEYEGIQVAKNLSTILSSLVDQRDDDNVEDLISENILSASEDSEDSDSAMEMRFATDSEDAESQLETEGATIKIAIVDDDQIIRTLVKKAFSKIGAVSDLYPNGRDFLTEVVLKKEKIYDLVILDIFMEGVNGFDVLLKLKENKITIPVIIYSQAFKREIIIKALALGARSYLLKPQKPEALIQKAMEVLNAEKR